MGFKAKLLTLFKWQYLKINRIQNTTKACPQPPPVSCPLDGREGTADTEFHKLDTKLDSTGAGTQRLRAKQEQRLWAERYEQSRSTVPVSPRADRNPVHRKKRPLWLTQKRNRTSEVSISKPPPEPMSSRQTHSHL